MTDKHDTWNEWSRHVLSDLKRHEDKLEDLSDTIVSFDRRIEEKLNKLHTEIITLKTKSSTWGALAGFIGGSIISAIVSAIVSAIASSKIR